MAIKASIRRERLLEAARGYLDLNMPDHALQQLKAIGDSEACTFALNSLRGDALRQKKEFDSALSAYHRALDEEPNDLSVLMGAAWCYKRTDQLSRAITTIEHAYRTSPEEPVVLYNLACYYTLAGNKSQALSWLGRALRMEKNLRQLIPDESDFDSLRDDPDFQFVVKSLDSAEMT